MDFTAIDFETANHRRDSACQLAAVVVQGGQIVNRQKWLIRPRPFYFNPRNVAVHGIRPDDVAGELEFAELWSSISPFLKDTCLVAHNAAFDIGVLVECLRSHELVTPDLQFTCTRLISRAVWPGQSGYGLKRIAERLGIEFRHHDALEDSMACAKILLAAANVSGAKTLEQLESSYRLGRGHATAAGYVGAKRATPSRRSSSRVVQASNRRPDYVQPGAVSESSRMYSTSQEPRELQSVAPEKHVGEVDIQRLFIRADFLKRLAGQRIVFAGRLSRMSQSHAEQFAVRLGASLQSQVATDTDLLVLGCEDGVSGEVCVPIEDATSLAERLNAEGYCIRMISEEEFISLV